MGKNLKVLQKSAKPCPSGCFQGLYNRIIMGAKFFKTGPFQGHMDKLICFKIKQPSVIKNLKKRKKKEKLQHLAAVGRTRDQFTYTHILIFQISAIKQQRHLKKI